MSSVRESPLTSRGLNLFVDHSASLFAISQSESDMVSKMSQVQSLTLETQLPVVVFQSEDDTGISPPLQLHQNQETTDTSIENTPDPTPSQHVFEAATVVPVNQARKFSIIILLVMANVVQVRSYFFYKGETILIGIIDDRELCRSRRRKYFCQCDGRKSGLWLMDSRQLRVSHSHTYCKLLYEKYSHIK